MAHIPRAMVVEDDPRIRRIITKVLGSCGMMVRTAIDGVDALNAFNSRGGEPELVCADIKMPNMDGKEFAKRLRQQGIGVPIIFVSGTIQKPQEGYRAKSHIYLMAKPFSPQKLAEVARDMLAKPRPRIGPRLMAAPVKKPEDLPPAPTAPPKGFDSGEFPASRQSSRRVPPAPPAARPAPPPAPQAPRPAPPAPRPVPPPVPQAPRPAPPAPRPVSPPAPQAPRPAPPAPRPVPPPAPQAPRPVPPPVPQAPRPVPPAPRPVPPPAPQTPRPAPPAPRPAPPPAPQAPRPAPPGPRPSAPPPPPPAPPPARPPAQ